MARTKRKRLPPEPVETVVEGFSHDGRGVARCNDKTVFLDGGLPGEEVVFTYSFRRRDFDAGVVRSVRVPSPDRVEPRCPHFGICGGCSLQHLAPEAQVRLKQQVLLDNLKHIGKVEPETVLEPLTGPIWGYRRKARLGVKYVVKKGKLLVGFRERRSSLLADLHRCEVLHPSVGERLGVLAELIAGLDAHDRIAQIEVGVAEEGTALVFRNLEPLNGSDQAKLRRFAQEQGFLVYLQPGGPDTVTPFWPESIALSYHLPAHDVRLRFTPTDFTQVNARINESMVDQALALLEPGPGDRVLELFCGLGNFTLPIARKAAAVVGVEGDVQLVDRARDNAAGNGQANATFHAADLTGDLQGAPWWGGGFNKVLLDPPRSGAWETLEHLARYSPERMVYVSCNPATLARDAGYLMNEAGYRLASVGIMDMFPHTSHVESIALFIR